MGLGGWGSMTTDLKQCQVMARHRLRARYLIVPVHTGGHPPASCRSHHESAALAHRYGQIDAASRTDEANADQRPCPDEIHPTSVTVAAELFLRSFE